jgi:UDP-glucose 4-epimerase
MVIGSPNHRRWVYAVSKLYDENVTIAFLEKYHKPYNIVRFFNIYGENSALDWTGGAIPQFIGNILQGKKIEIHGDGEQKRCFTYIDDVVDALMKLINSDVKNETMNIGNTDMVTINELADIIYDQIGGKRQIKHLSYENFFGDYEDVVIRQPDITKVTKLLGWKPTTELVDGLTKTIKWQKARMGV